MPITPETTYAALLIINALHLLHHRWAKRHISYAEATAAALLCVPITALPAGLIMSAHGAMITIQVAGSLFIRKLSPDWQEAH